MRTLQRFYNRRFGDYGTMQACRSCSDEHKRMVKDFGEYTRDDWQDKHRAWTYEPLLGDS